MQARARAVVLALLPFLGCSSLEPTSDSSGSSSGSSGGAPVGWPCVASTDCDPDAYCARPAGRCAGEGRCAERPGWCGGEPTEPVCGCDGAYHRNACELAAAGLGAALAVQECPQAWLCPAGGCEIEGTCMTCPELAARASAVIPGA